MRHHHNSLQSLVTQPPYIIIINKKGNDNKQEIHNNHFEVNYILEMNHTLSYKMEVSVCVCVCVCVHRSRDCERTKGRRDIIFFLNERSQSRDVGKLMPP